MSFPNAFKDCSMGCVNNATNQVPRIAATDVCLLIQLNILLLWNAQLSTQINEEHTTTYVYL